MCGLNLLWDKQNNLPTQQAILQMCQATAHRGQDEQQTCTLSIAQGQLFLGHNRLKIRDLSPLSRQPYTLPDSQKYLLYNGELYSKEEALTHSDTAWLYQYLSTHLKHYTPEEIHAVLALLNGMYAFVWIDLAQLRLLAARDTWQIKPLYYFENEQYLIISSEIKGILASNLVHKAINESQIVPYLLNRYAASPATFFKGIYQITTPLQWNLQSFQKTTLPKVQTLCYSQPSNLPSQTLLQATEQALKQAITQQLVAKVPVGLFLSGGVDSTLLLAVLRELGHTQFPVFTLALAAQDQAKGTQDTYFAQQAARQYGADLQLLTLEENCLENIEEWAVQLDQPIADSAAYLTYLLSQEARKSVKVAFTGAGADELFAGYHRHVAFKQYLRHPKAWLIFKQMVSPLLGLVPEYGQTKYKEKLRQVKKFLDKLTAYPSSTFINFTQMAWEKGLKIPPSLAEALPSKQSKEDALRFALHYDQQHFLAQDVLALTDHASMQHGLEVRVPYLDASVTGVLTQASATQVFGKDKKWLLKALLAQRGGEIYTQRRKEGFGFPFGYWLRKSTHRHIVEKLLDREHLVYDYLEYAWTRQKIQAHQKGKIDFSTEIWALWILNTWLKHQS